MMLTCCGSGGGWLSHHLFHLELRQVQDVCVERFLFSVVPEQLDVFCGESICKRCSITSCYWRLGVKSDGIFSAIFTVKNNGEIANYKTVTKPLGIQIWRHFLPDLVYCQFDTRIIGNYNSCILLTLRCRVQALYKYSPYTDGSWKNIVYALKKFQSFFFMKRVPRLLIIFSVLVI